MNIVLFIYWSNLRLVDSLKFEMCTYFLGSREYVWTLNHLFYPVNFEILNYMVLRAIVGLNMAYIYVFLPNKDVMAFNTRMQVGRSTALQIVHFNTNPKCMYPSTLVIDAGPGVYALFIDMWSIVLLVILAYTFIIFHVWLLYSEWNIHSGT